VVQFATPLIERLATALSLSRRELVALVLVFVVSLPAVTSRIYATDEVQYFSFLRSFWFDRDVSFENEYRYFHDRGIGRSVGFYQTHLQLETETGRRENFGTIGCAILWAPFYGVADAAVRGARAVDSSWPRGAARGGGAPASDEPGGVQGSPPTRDDGYSKPYVAAVCYGSAFYGFAALLLSIASARRLGLAAFSSTLAIWAGTPLLFYMYVAPPMAHACSAFAVSLLIWIWLRVRETWPAGGLVALGACGALVAMVREQDVLLLCGPALDFAVWVSRGAASRSRARSLIGGVLGAMAAFVLVYAPQAAVYLRLNGRLGPSRLVTRKMDWSAPHALSVLFSPEHGFFVWTPLALLAIAGLIWMMLAETPAEPSRAAPRRLAACLVLMIAAQVYSAGSVESWTVAGAFGQRRFVAITPLLIIGFAALQRAVASTRARHLLAVAAVAAVYWNLALMAEFATGLMDRQRLEPVRNAYDAFVTIPRMAPDLVYRYLFDRASFYQTSAPQ